MKSLMDRVRGVRDELSDRILQQHKDTAHDHLNRGTQFLTKEYFPEERREPIYLPKQEGIMVCFLCSFIANSLFPGHVRSMTIIKSPSNGFCLMLRSMPVMGR